MEIIENINGLTVEYIEGNRTVHYNGTPCPRIGVDEVRCEERTSYQGCLLRQTETFNTPIGIVERSYRCWGPGLECAEETWRIVPQGEIIEAQMRFEKASEELTQARRNLELFSSK